MIGYNHALIFVPTLYLSLLVIARHNVSLKISFASSLSLVKVIANGFKNSALDTRSWLNSRAPILRMIYHIKIKIMPRRNVRYRTSGEILTMNFCGQTVTGCMTKGRVKPKAILSLKSKAQSLKLNSVVFS